MPSMLEDKTRKSRALFFYGSIKTFLIILKHPERLSLFRRNKQFIECLQVKKKITGKVLGSILQKQCGKCMFINLSCHLYCFYIRNITQFPLTQPHVFYFFAKPLRLLGLLRYRTLFSNRPEPMPSCFRHALRSRIQNLNLF